MRDVEHSAVVFVDSEVLRAALIVVEIILGAVAVGLVRDLLGGEALRQRKLDGNAAVEHVVGDILGFAFLFTVDVNGGSRVSFKGQGSVVGIAQVRSNGLDSDIDYNGDGIAFIELGSLNTSISNQLVLRIVGQSIRNIFDSGPADDSLNSIGISSFNALINGNSDFISHDDGHFIRLFIGHHIGVTSLIGLDDIVVIVNISAGVNGEVTAGDGETTSINFLNIAVEIAAFNGYSAIITANIKFTSESAILNSQLTDVICGIATAVVNCIQRVSNEFAVVDGSNVVIHECSLRVVRKSAVIDGQGSTVIVLNGIKTTDERTAVDSQNCTVFGNFGLTVFTGICLIGILPAICNQTRVSTKCTAVVCAILLDSNTSVDNHGAKIFQRIEAVAAVIIVSSASFIATVKCTTI